jgi:hypothetical protein
LGYNIERYDRIYFPDLGQSNSNRCERSCLVSELWGGGGALIEYTGSSWINHYLPKYTGNAGTGIVQGVAIGKGTIWVRCPTCLAFGRDSTWTVVPGTASSRLETSWLELDTAGTAWFSQYGKLFRFRTASEWDTLNLVDAGMSMYSKIKTFRIDRNNTIWVATDDAKLLTLTPGSGTWTDLKVDFATNSMVFDKNGSLWLSAYNKLARYSGGILKVYEGGTTGLPALKGVGALAVDKNNFIWATSDSSILRFDSSMTPVVWHPAAGKNGGLVVRGNHSGMTLVNNTSRNVHAKVNVVTLTGRMVAGPFPVSLSPCQRTNLPLEVKMVPNGIYAINVEEIGGARNYSIRFFGR